MEEFEPRIEFDIILNNEADESQTRRFGPYNPYCLRCSGLARMTKRAPHVWGCRCGAVCDLREYAAQREQYLVEQMVASGKLTDVEREYYLEAGGDA